MPEKRRPPKPGTKRAQMLGANSMKFALPKCYRYQNVLFLLFQTPGDVKKSLGRVHQLYEKGELKGPLKGVNLPFDFYMNWYRDVGKLEVEEEQLSSILTLEQLQDCEYLIACLEKDKSTILHEWAHAFYYFDKSYQEYIEQEWTALDTNLQNVITKELEMRNYHPGVFLDEFQAYVRENPGDFGKKYTQMLTPLHLRLKKKIQLPMVFVEENKVDYVSWSTSHGTNNSVFDMNQVASALP